MDVPDAPERPRRCHPGFQDVGEAAYLAISSLRLEKLDAVGEDPDINSRDGHFGQIKKTMLG